MRTRLGRTYTGSPERANAALNAGWFVGASERSAEVVVIAAPLEDVMIVSTSNPAATEATAKKHNVEASAHLREKDIIASERRDWNALRAQRSARLRTFGGKSTHTINRTGFGAAKTITYWSYGNQSEGFDVSSLRCTAGNHLS